MNLVKHQGNVLKQLGSASIVPGVSDAVNNFVDNVTGESKDEKIKELEAQVAAGKKTQQQAQMEAGMKKGGKVKSASARADGCCIRGRTRA